MESERVGLTVELSLDNWSSRFTTRGVVYLRGYIINLERVVSRLDGLLDAQLAQSIESISSIMSDAEGQFGLVYCRDGFVVGACDRIRSHPIVYSDKSGVLVLSDSAAIFEGWSKSAEVEIDAVASIAMSGCACGDLTLYRGVRNLQAGEFVVFDRATGSRHVARYYHYRPWLYEHRPYPEQKHRLRDVTLSAIERMVNSIGGRKVCLGLSAGMDSRLILSALHKINFKNVLCYSYGLPDNYEVRAARDLCNQLGYPWVYVPTNHRIMRAMYESSDYQDYLSQVDTFAATPSVHQFHVVGELIRSEQVTPEDVFVNGYSGDYITGGHIPRNLTTQGCLDGSSIQDRLRDAIINKHFSLWRHLKTDNNLKRIGQMILNRFQSAGLDIDAMDDSVAFAYYEWFEWQHRQTLWSMNQPRVYEYWGHEWRFPLWDRHFVDFWQATPPEQKLQRKLLKDMLSEENWAGVWRDVSFPRFNSPRSVAALRLATKALAIPFGTPFWESIDRRYFSYHLDILCLSACVDSSVVRNDTRGYRNAISWLTEIYLGRIHGVDTSKILLQ